MAKIKPLRGHFNRSRATAALIGQGMKPMQAKAKAKSLQLKSHNKMKKHMALQQRTAEKTAQAKTAQNLAAIGKVKYAASLFSQHIAGPMSRMASYGRNFRSRY